MSQVTRFIKIILTVLFFVCLLDMPYDFYELVRFVSLIGFGLLAYKAHQENNNTKMIIYGGLAILFQPFIKVALGRVIWNIIDVIVGIGLIVSLIMKRRKN